MLKVIHLTRLSQIIEKKGGTFFLPRLQKTELCSIFLQPSVTF